MKTLVNYKGIFIDILEAKYPQKKEECLPLLQKKGNLTAIDVLKINKKIFGYSKENEISNPKHYSYSQSDILKILDYQKENRFNNSQLANHFGLSRNTVARWKKLFLV